MSTTERPKSRRPGFLDAFFRRTPAYTPGYRRPESDKPPVEEKGGGIEATAARVEAAVAGLETRFDEAVRAIGIKVDSGLTDIRREVAEIRSDRPTAIYSTPPGPVRAAMEPRGGSPTFVKIHGAADFDDVLPLTSRIYADLIYDKFLLGYIAATQDEDEFHARNDPMHVDFKWRFSHDLPIQAGSYRAHRYISFPVDLDHIDPDDLKRVLSVLKSLSEREV